MEDGDLSERAGEGARIWVVCSGGSEVVSESMVYSDGGLGFFLWTGVDVRVREACCGVRALAGLAVLVRGARWGDFARTVLGCEWVVEVRSVISKAASSRTLEREAMRGPACEVMCVLQSASAAVVAVRGGLGGGRGGVGAVRAGGGGIVVDAGAEAVVVVVVVVAVAVPGVGLSSRA